MKLDPGNSKTKTNRNFIPGCYSDSAGLELVRNHVAKYIEHRDGFPADPSNIILCAGASEGIRVSIANLFLSFLIALTFAIYLLLRNRFIVYAENVVHD